jgi:hypothetical protein
MDICISVPCDAAAGELDTVVVVMTYCDDDLMCAPDCGDCEDPNWYLDNPYYSTTTTIIKVMPTPPSLYILQDSLTLIDQGCPYAGVLFSICNAAVCLEESFEYRITSRGHIGPLVDTTGTVPDLPAAECMDVVAMIDASEAGISDMDTLTIIAWSLGTPVVYDTCVQLVQVVEPEYVPVFSAPVSVITALLMVMAASLFLKKRSKISTNLILLVVASGLLIACMPDASEAKEKKSAKKEIAREWRSPEIILPTDQHGQMRRLSASVDTYTIVRYDFFSSWQGWTRMDNTAQPDTFFHVDDFAGISPGAWGGYVPLEGTKSMWCGARPDYGDEYMCHWATPPGYGSGWSQMLVSSPVWVPPPLTLSYRMYVDVEPDYDLVSVEYDAGGLNWVPLATYDGTHDTTASHTLFIYTGMDDLRKGLAPSASGCRTKIRIHFTSDGEWSDEDGLWNTDGACHIDSITISGSQGVVDFEDFESASVGDKASGIWRADVQAPYGMYSNLAANLVDWDPCESNASRQIIFFSGSTNPNPDYPGLFNTPFCKGYGGLESPCQDEMVVSPPIDMTRYSTGNDEYQDAEIPPGALAGLGGAKLKFTVYRDLPLRNLVFYYWHVRNIVAGCPGEWLDRNYVYYGTSVQDYFFVDKAIGDLVGDEPIQVALGVVDMCDAWYGPYGNCAAHTPSPYFDNVEVQRYETVGPQWYYRSIDLFQDNFPEEEFDLESWVRADMALDLRPEADPEIDPGDSIVVTCASPLGGGIATVGPYPAVFMHCRVTHLGPDSKIPPSGPALEGTYGHFHSTDGDWTIIVGEVTPGPDRYMFDLNDSLMTRGFLVEYYFKAEDNAGASTTLPGDAETAGRYFEFTCLPTLSSDILYVDDYHAIGSFDGAVNNYLDQAFRAVLPDTNQPDRYDVNKTQSSYGVSNGPATRALANHLSYAYNKIIWDSGNLTEQTICDGNAWHSDKSEDCRMLVDWLDLSEHDCGLWIMGDNVAADLSRSINPYASALMIDYCGTAFVADSYFDLTGEVVPKVKGAATNIFYHGVPDSFYAHGLCPSINHFDVLDATGTGAHALAYPHGGGETYYAGIQNEKTNNFGYTMRTMWFGMSFMSIIDAEFVDYEYPFEDPYPIVRYRMMRDVIEWMGNTANYDITEGETPPAYIFDLAQNYPNPFNPSTTFRFSLATKSHVEIKIYTVAGKLVKVLVDREMPAGPHVTTWDGTNESGNHISSGVYFCRMQAKDFTEVKKVVLVR